MRKKEYKKVINENIEPIDVFDKIKNYAYEKKYDIEYETRKFNWKIFMKTSISVICTIAIVFVGIIIFDKKLREVSDSKELSPSFPVESNPNNDYTKNNTEKPNDPINPGTSGGGTDYKEEPQDNNQTNLIVESVISEYNKRIEENTVIVNSFKIISAADIRQIVTCFENGDKIVNFTTEDDNLSNNNTTIQFNGTSTMIVVSNDQAKLLYDIYINEKEKLNTNVTP